jgi:hypothetical protein
LYIFGEGEIKLVNVSFKNNTATLVGGGIYMYPECKLTITTDENKISEFVGNKANGQSNGIYMYGAGTITFNGNGRVNMEDAIIATNGSVNIGDNCEFNLSSGGISKIGNLKIGDSSKFNLKSNAQMEILGDLTIERRGVFNMQEAKDKIIVGGNYNQEGMWEIDIKKEKEQSEIFFVRDYLDVRGKVNLEPGSTLSVDMREQKENNELRSYRLIKYGNSCSGEFGRLVFSNTSRNLSYKLIYNYDNDSIVLTVKGSTRTKRGSKVSVGTNFARIKGLSFNQKGVGRVLDNLSVADEGVEKKK